MAFHKPFCVLDLSTNLTGERSSTAVTCDQMFATCVENNQIFVPTSENTWNYESSMERKTYSTKQYLQIHTGQHTGEKSHCCEECGKAFADPSALKNHQKQYQHNQPVACEVCGKTFKIQKNMKSHMMIHNTDTDK